MSKNKSDLHSLTDDELLILIVQNEDMTAFSILLERYFPLINKTVNNYYITGYDQEDLVQESRLTFWKVVQQFEKTYGVTLGQYFRKALKNGMNSLLRKDLAEKRHIDKIAESLESFKDRETGKEFWENFHINETFLPDDYVSLNEKYTNFESKLSQMESAVFNLYLEGLVFEEIAQTLNYEETKVRNAFDRCRRKLREELQSE